MTKKTWLSIALFILVATMIAYLALSCNGDSEETIEVIVHGDFDTSIAELHEEVRQRNGTVLRELPLINAVVAEIPVSARSDISSDEDISHTEENAVVRLFEPKVETYSESESQIVPWGAQKINASPPLGGRGVTVVVCDTGINPEHRDIRVEGGRGFVRGDTSWNDGHGHGTHVAGTIAALDNDFDVVGIVPDVTLFAGRVLNDNGSGSTGGIIACLDWAVSINADVVNFSLGGPIPSKSFQTAVTNAARAGTVVVAAAGNSGPRKNTIGYPAAYEGTVAVAATDDTDRVAVFSSRGRQLHVAAPGVDIPSLNHRGGVVSFSGTSMACPHVVGVVAAMRMANPSSSVECIADVLAETAIDLSEQGHDENYGHGRIDAAAAVRKIREVCP